MASSFPSTSVRSGIGGVDEIEENDRIQSSVRRRRDHYDRYRSGGGNDYHDYNHRERHRYHKRDSHQWRHRSPHRDHRDRESHRERFSYNNSRDRGSRNWDRDHNHDRSERNQRLSDFNSRWGHNGYHQDNDDINISSSRQRGGRCSGGRRSRSPDSPRSPPIDDTSCKESVMNLKPKLVDDRQVQLTVAAVSVPRRGNQKGHQPEGEEHGEEVPASTVVTNHVPPHLDPRVPPHILQHEGAKHHGGNSSSYSVASESGYSGYHSSGAASDGSRRDVACYESGSVASVGGASGILGVPMGETRFPHASYATSETAKSDIATVCSGSVVDEIELASVLSGDLNTSGTGVGDKLTPNVAFSSGGLTSSLTDRVMSLTRKSSLLSTAGSTCGEKVASSSTTMGVEFASQVLQLGNQHRNSNAIIMQLNDMGPPLSRDLLGTNSHPGSTHSSSVGGVSSDLVAHVDTDDNGSIAGELDAHSVHSTFSKESGGHLNQDVVAGQTPGRGVAMEPQTDSNEGDPQQTSSLMAVASQQRLNNGGRTSPGGTVYKGRGVRRYQGRYMHLPLKRFHQNASCGGGEGSVHFLHPEFDDVGPPDDVLRSRSRSRSRSPRRRSWSRSPDSIPIRGRGGSVHFRPGVRSRSRSPRGWTRNHSHGRSRNRDRSTSPRLRDRGCRRNHSTHFGRSTSSSPLGGYKNRSNHSRSLSPHGGVNNNKERHGCSSRSPSPIRHKYEHDNGRRGNCMSSRVDNRRVYKEEHNRRSHSRSKSPNHSSRDRRCRRSHSRSKCKRSPS